MSRAAAPSSLVFPLCWQTQSMSRTSGQDLPSLTMVVWPLAIYRLDWVDILLAYAWP